MHKGFTVALALVGGGLALAAPASAATSTCAELPAKLAAVTTADPVVQMTEGACTVPSAGYTLPPRVDLRGAPTSFVGSGSNPAFKSGTTGSVRLASLSVSPSATSNPALDIDTSSSVELQDVQVNGGVSSSGGGPFTAIRTTLGPSTSVQGSDVVFRGGTLTGGVGVTGHVLLDDMRFGAGGSSYSMSLSGLAGQDVTVADSTFDVSALGLGMSTGASAEVAFLRNVVRGPQGNSISISISSATDRGTTRFADNTFAGNKSTGIGLGGPALFFERNRFTDNQSLSMSHSGSSALTSSGNLFRDNATMGFAQSSPAYESTNDRYVRNNRDNPNGSGGPLISGTCAPNQAPVVNLRGSVYVDNAAATSGGPATRITGPGGTCGSVPGKAKVTVSNSTVVGSRGGGIDATNSTLSLRNSILNGNGGYDTRGFDSTDTQFSDVCPLPAGAGNFCQPPQIDGDGRIAATSPARNTGSNALIPAGLTTDAFGAARISEGTVDVGADEFDVAPAGLGASGTADRVAPVISGAKLSRTRFAVGPKATARTAAKKKGKRKKAKRKSTGTTLSYRLSEAATVAIKIDRKTRGYKAGKRCRSKKPKGKKRAKRCNIYKSAGTLTRKSKAGANKVAFSGRIGRKKLKRGNYRMTITPTDAARNKGRARTLSFAIVR